MSQSTDTPTGDAPPSKPVKVVLCGSTRFVKAFDEANFRETLAGHIVLTIGVDMRARASEFADKTPDELADIKAKLDELHKRKIDDADEILVLNVDGYMGASTRSEILYAVAAGKTVRYLEPDAAPIAGDTYGDWTIDAFRIPGNPQDCLVVLRQAGIAVRKFTCPIYKIWTVLAHWRDDI